MDNDQLFIAARVFAVNEDGTYRIPYKPEDVFSALKNSISQIQGFKVRNINDFGLSMDISAGMSWKSWGETIQISILPSPVFDSILSIKSKSHYALADWGKNKENIYNILSELQAELKNSKYKEVAVNTEVRNEDPADRLIKLKALFDNNIINEEEYNNKKAQLLNQL